MTEAFKNLYNEKFYLVLARHLNNCIIDFNEDKFMQLIMPDNFEQLELKHKYFVNCNKRNCLS